jgi:hypothetical protein
MATGFLASALMCLMLGQNPGDTLYFNLRNHRVPVTVPPALQADIRELLLYASTDQGRTWSLVAQPITADKDHFAFYAPGDGNYWLRVVEVHRNGAQVPDDRGIKTGPPNMKLVIDTVKPIIKSFQVQRLDDDVYVSWELQEDNLDPNGMRLEFQTKNALIDQWKAIPIQAALQGHARFNPGTKQPLSLRLTVRDLAKNESWSLKELAGTLMPANFSTAQDPAVGPVLPQEIVVQPEGPKPYIAPMPPPVAIEITMPKAQIEITTPRTQFGGPGGVVLPPPLPKERVGEKVVADSTLPPPPPTKAPQPLGGIGAPAGGFPSVGGVQAPPHEAPIDVKTIANPASARRLPPIKHVNEHQIMLEYELKRVGPSGIGGIEVWLTKDDGLTWEPFAVDPDVQSGTVTRRQQRKFDMRDAGDRPFPDGIYGLSLVVKSRAGIGRKPRPGDVPEIRIEIDTKLPDAQLFMPVADPQNPDQILLKWNAFDKNLADRPINLEYAERLDGEWLPIQLNMENTGRYATERVGREQFVKGSVTGDYSWKVPPNTPLQVYLRMRVRDRAGNERIIVTERPQFVDLTEPEGHITGVEPPAGKGP